MHFLLAFLLLPPQTPVKPVRDQYHGATVVDPYRWLEEDKAPETRAWIDEQMKYTRSLLDPLPNRAAIRERLTQLMRIDATGLPVERGGRLFYSRRGAAQNRASLYMRQGISGTEELLIDPARISADESLSVMLADVSQDGKLLAYGVREGGADEYAIHFFDVDARVEYGEILPRDKYFTAYIAPGRKTVYYSLLTTQGPRVRHHHFGRKAQEDATIFGESYGPDYFISPWLSEDGRHLVLNVAQGSAGSNTETFLMDLSRGQTITQIEGDPKARSFAVTAGNDIYYFTTAGAPKGKLYRIPIDTPQKHFWKLIVPESADNLENWEFSGGKLAVTHTVNATSRLTLITRDGAIVGNINLPAPGTVAATSGRWSSPHLFLQFTSFAWPSTVLHQDTASGVQDVWTRAQVPFDSTSFDTQQVWYKSKDGTRVPMFVVKRKDTPLDGSRPTLLTGYGGFTVSMSPTFDPEAALWIENGGVYALPNLRGGGEFGEAWHQAGMFERKQNVFDDFTSAAEWLIANRYTNPGKLAIEGGSNGGLLVGAAMTQRPDLFRAVVCAVPLLDMLRYQKFLVARLWVPEYGSSGDPAQFGYLYRYSPYHNVKDGTKYPAVMFVTGDSDTRVAPLHARKMTARMQAASRSGLPVLLHYDTKAGHAGGTPVNKQIDDGTDSLSFLMWQLEATPASSPKPPVAR